MAFVILDGFAFRNVQTDHWFYDSDSSIQQVTPFFPWSNAVQGIVFWDFGAPEEFEDVCVGLRWQNALNGQSPITLKNNLSGFTCFIGCDGMGRFNFNATLNGSPNYTDTSTLWVAANEINYLELSVQTSKVHIPYDPGPPEVPEAYKMLVEYELRVNDEVFLEGGIETPQRVLFGSGLDTNPWISHLNIGAVEINALGEAAMSDFYINTPGTFKGDSSIRTLYPAADVGTDFTPSVGTVHYALVNDHPDNTTTNNSATATGQIDEYSFDTLPSWAGGTQTINGIAGIWHLGTSDPNTGGVFGFYNSPSHFTPNFYPLSDGSFTYFFDGREYVYGSTSVKWTEGAINTITLGLKRFL